MRKPLLPTLLAAAAALGLVLAPAGAAERTLTLDPERTEVTFELGATGHDVHGILHLDRGTVTFDTATGTASGEVVVDASLTETGNKKRDKTMHRKVLESATHKEMVFRASGIEGELAPSGPSDVTLVGTMTVVGRDHPFRIPAKVEVTGDQVSATATFEVPYVEWGLHDPSAFILRVAKKVEVSITAKGTLEESGSAATGASR